MSAYVYKNIYARMFSLICNSPKLETNQMFIHNRWLKKQYKKQNKQKINNNNNPQYIHTMEHYTAMKSVTSTDNNMDKLYNVE